MSINILDTIKSQVGIQIAGQIGSKFGVNEQVAKTGIDALLPTILGGLVSKVSAPGGAEKLDKTLTEGGFDGGMLDNLTGMFSGDKGDNLAKQGGDLVSMIFGDKAAILCPILAKLTGMKSDSLMSMLAMLAPLVMSFLAKQKSATGMSASGLATMLVSQKDSIAKALPPGVSDAMGLGLTSPSAVALAPAGGGFGVLKVLVPLAILVAVGYASYKYIFDGIRPSGPEGNVVIQYDPNAFEPGQEGDWAAAAATAGGGAGAAPSDTTSAPAAANPPTARVDSSTAYQAALTAAKKASETAEKATAAGEKATETVEKATEKAAMPNLAALAGAIKDAVPEVAGFDTAELTKTFESLSGTFGKIKDVDSAKAALPELETMDKQLQGVTSGLSALPEGVRSIATTAIKKFAPQMESMVEKVFAIPGAKEILQPIIDSIMGKIRPLAA